MSVSHLDIVRAVREGGPNQARRDFGDFVVDGRSLYDAFGRRLDLIGCLGWGHPKSQRLHQRRLLLKGPADLAGDRRSLYICPECGDLGCGCISCVVTRKGDLVEWSEFGSQSDFEPPILGGDWAGIGPFTFRWSEYVDALSAWGAS